MNKRVVTCDFCKKPIENELYFLVNFYPMYEENGTLKAECGLERTYDICKKCFSKIKLDT